MGDASGKRTNIMVGGSRRDGETGTASVQALEVEGEGMTALTRRYECLFPGDLQGAVHMRTKGTTRREMVFGQGESGLDSETALAVKVLTWLERAVHHLGGIPVLGWSVRVTGEVLECVPESCKLRDERVEAGK